MSNHITELLEKHFDTAFAAPDGIKKLRELILTLAMQGKLVPQDPNEQPASELLERSRAQMASAMNGGGAKRERAAASVEENEKRFLPPNAWAWCRLVDLGQFINGAAFKQSDWDKTGRPIIRIQNLSGRSVAFNRTRKEFDESILVKKGDILVSWSATLDAYIWHGEEGVLNQHIFRVLPAPLVNKKYLFWLLKWVIRQLAESDHAHGLVMTHINRGPFLAYPIAIPPMEEQVRIVNKFDELIARCDELERVRTAQQETRLIVHTAAIKQLLNIAEPDQHQRAQAFLAEHFGELYTVKENVAELRKAILQLAVMGKLVPQDPNDQPASELLKEIEVEKQRLVKEGKIKKPKLLPPVTEEEKPYALPQGWEWVRLGVVGSFERGKSKHRPRNDKRLFEGGTYPFVQTGDVSRAKRTKDQILTCGSFYNNFGLQQSRLWERNTLCITIAANIAETGFLGMDACMPDSVVAFISIDPALSKHVKIFIDVAKDNLERFAPSTAQKNINLEIINELAFPLPPLLEQRCIVAKIDDLMALCDTLDQHINSVSSKQTELLNALVHAQSLAKAELPVVRSSATITNLADYRAAIGCYALGKLANAKYFGRTAAAKVLYMAQAHVGLELHFQPEREVAGPLDKWIYDFERQGQGKYWFEVNEKPLASGHKKAEYRCLPALAEPASQAEAAMKPEQKAEFDRLIYALADKKTEEVEIIATLFAVWNDFLIDGLQPTDEQIICEMRENWHERKARFTLAELGRWLDWLRRENIIPQGQSPRTVQQSRLDLD